MPFVVARVRDGGLELWWSRTVYESRKEAMRERDGAREWEADVEHDGPRTEVYALHPQ